MKGLPLKEDHDKSMAFCSCLCNLLLSSHRQVTGLKSPKILTVCRPCSSLHLLWYTIRRSVLEDPGLFIGTQDDVTHRLFKHPSSSIASLGETSSLGEIAGWIHEHTE